MDWIVKYWVEVLFGGITAAVGLLYRLLLTERKRRKALKAGVRAMLRNDIIKLADKYLDAGEPRTTKTQRFGPATRWDLRKLLDRADALGLYVVGTLDIGPMTEGDVSTMAALGARLGLDMTEV